MKTSNRLMIASLLGWASALAHSPALAEQWRIINATIQEISEEPRDSSQPPALLAQLPNAGAPFRDGAYFSAGAPWSEHAAWGIAEERYAYRSEWWLRFTPQAGAAPSVDLTNLLADFSSLELLLSTAVYEGPMFGWYQYETSLAWLGLDDAVPITALSNGRYQASWLARSSSGGGLQEDPSNPLYSVNLTFVAFPEGTPWSYAPVPEASSVYMALVGLGAVGLIRRRQKRQVATA